MAHYALLDDNNIVTNVITGRDENDRPPEVDSWEGYYGALHNCRCLRTSYNTVANEHDLGGVPFRGNFAGKGFRYDDDLDAFIPPQPFPSWTLNPTTLNWVAPVAEPDFDPENPDQQWGWDEDSLSWLPLTD
jgi:hypothetical protein